MRAQQQLMRPRFDVIGRKANFGRIENARQVVFEVFKHHENVLGKVSTVQRFFCTAQNGHVRKIKKFVAEALYRARTKITSNDP